MKNIKLFLVLATALFAWSCSEDDLDSKSIFENETVAEQNEFDKWLVQNYVIPYNIDFKYRYDDKESDMTYNLIPADYDKSIALAKLIQHVWLDSYNEVAGENFMKENCLRVMQLIGSKAYNEDESVTLGVAEGGIKVTLYNVNEIDVDNIDLDVLNYWFFKTMHHEFCHILNQLKEYTTDFNLVSQGKYKAADWINLKDKDAPALGFISGYASKEEGEDFAELTSIYVTSTEEAWQAQLDLGVVPVLDNEGNPTGQYDSTGKETIEAKFDIVKEYFLTKWNIDLTTLRDVVQRRTQEIYTLDLKNLN